MATTATRTRASSSTSKRVRNDKWGRLQAYAQQQTAHADDTISALQNLGFARDVAVARVAAANIGPDDDESTAIAKALRADPSTAEAKLAAAVRAAPGAGSTTTPIDEPPSPLAPLVVPPTPDGGTNDSGPDDLRQSGTPDAEAVAAQTAAQANETPAQRQARELAEQQAEQQKAALDKLRQYPNQVWAQDIQPALDDFAERLGSAPKPGGILALVFVLLVFICFIVPVDATGRYTRFQLLWQAVTGNARLKNAQKSGVGAPNPAVMIDDITADVAAAAKTIEKDISTVAGTVGGDIGAIGKDVQGALGTAGNDVGRAGQWIAQHARGIFDLTSYNASLPPNLTATSTPPTSGPM